MAPLKAPGNREAPPRRRHRGIQFVGIGVGVLFLGALVVVLLSSGRVQGSIPGSDSILSLAAIPRGFLVGTAGGVLQSPDGRTWLAATNIPREPVSVASDGTTSYVLAGGTLKSTRDMRTFGTPSQAVLVDPSSPQRILLGTPGGLLVSENGGLQWHQTEMRKDVHGLSQEGGRFFAVTTERLVYGSNDGTSGWTAFTA